LGGKRPQQFLEVDGIPVIIRTLGQFQRCREIDRVVVVFPVSELEETADWVRSVAKESGWQKPIITVAGGATRAQSVQKGLAVIRGAELIAVHDGWRPFVTPGEIDRVVNAARTGGAAILVAPVADTIKEIKDGRILCTLPRI